MVARLRDNFQEASVVDRALGSWVGGSSLHFGFCFVSGVTPDTKYELRLSAATKNGFPANLGDWSHFTTPKADVGRSSLFGWEGQLVLDKWLVVLTGGKGSLLLWILSGRAGAPLSHPTPPLLPSQGGRALHHVTLLYRMIFVVVVFPL